MGMAKRGDRLVTILIKAGRLDLLSLLFAMIGAWHRCVHPWQRVGEIMPPIIPEIQWIWVVIAREACYARNTDLFDRALKGLDAYYDKADLYDMYWIADAKPLGPRSTPVETWTEYRVWYRSSLYAYLLDAIRLCQSDWHNKVVRHFKPHEDDLP
jgi:hypothetical protein